MKSLLIVTFFLGIEQQVNQTSSPQNTSGNQIFLIINIIWTVLLLVLMFRAFFKSKLLNKVISNNAVESSEKDEFRTVLYSIGDAVITTDLEGRIVRMNLIAEQLIEVSEANAKGIDSKQLYSIVSEDENGKFENPVDKVLKEKQKIELSNSALLKLKNGKAIPISDSASPIINELGKMIGVVLIFRDETENRRKKKLLKESENKFSTIFHSSPEGVIITSLTGEFIDVNERFLEMTGYSKNEIIGKTTGQLNFWKNIEERKKLIERIVKEQVKQSLEFEFRIKAGELRNGYLSTELIELGKEKVLLSIIQDITERKKAEQEIRIMSVALANINQAAFLIDMGEAFKYVNEAACKSLGYTKTELLKLKLSDIDPGFNMLDKYENLKLIKQNKSPRFETTHRRKNGETFPVEISSTYFDYEGQELILSLAENISERKFAERERQIHLWILQSLDKINLTIQSHIELDQMMSAVLEEVLAIFDCDRAFLLFPCDPFADKWIVPMERTKPEYPGVLTLGLEIPMDEHVAETLSTLINSEGPVKFGPGSEYPLPASASERFGFKSVLSMAIYPKSGKPWQFGIHQCSFARLWTKDEERLFREIGQRLADGLTSLITLNSLRASEERFRMLAENSRDVIYKMSLPDGKYEYVSPAVTQLFGYSTKEFYDNSSLFKSILHPDFHNYFEEQWQNLLNGSMPPTYEYKIIHKSGDERWFNQRNILSKDENNTPTSIEGIITDVTERKIAELALQELLTHNRSLLQLSKKLELASTYDEILDAAFVTVNKIIGYNNLWVYLIDDSNEHCLVLVAKGSVSKMILSFDHIAKLTIKGDRMLEEIVSQNNIVIVEDARTDERTNKEIVAQLENRTIVNVPIILFDKHLGSAGTGTFGEEGIKVPTKSEQEFLMALASHLAVTLDRVHLQQTKKEAEDRIRKLSAGIEQSPASVVITDLLGNVEYVNKRFTEVTGYTPEEIIGKHTRLLKSGDTPPEEYKLMWDTIIHKKEWRGEFHNKKKNGELYWELASISPIINETGEVTNFLAVKEDITHIKKMTEELISARNKAEEMNKVKAYFYAQMSHELRTPFVGIFGFAELLKEKLNDSEEKEMAEAIFKSSKRLMDTLNKVLDITKLEFDKLEPKFSNVDISKLLTSLKDMYQVTSQKQNTFINTKLNVKSFLLKTDERLLTEILNNLISNAVKYTINGLIEITTEVISKIEERFLIIKVSDNGIGIPEDKLEVIWDDFRQVSEGFNRTFEGTGLGLSITKKYVGLIGGKISVESKLDKGTTFTIELPCTKTDCIDEIITQILPTQGNSNKSKTIKKEKILFVEDEGITLLYVKKLLADLYEVDTADNATNALEKINQNYYSALLLDINLKKGIDGLKLMQLVREIPFYKTIPIAALTAFATSSDKIEFLNKGFSHYLSKPFDSVELFKLLENMLSIK